MANYDKLEPTRPAGSGQATFFGRNLLRSVLLLAVGLAPACSDIERANDSKLTIETPVDWWHDLQGGKIAEVRPPPPGVNDPYPNLGQVPARPLMTDPATRHALAARLAAQRDRTEREATQDPLVLPAAAVLPAKPAASAAPPQAASDAGASMAVLDAATAPAPAPPPTPAVAPPTKPAAASVTAGASTPQPDRPAVESGPLPDLPTAEPALPRLRGLPASVNEPAVPRLPPAVAIAFRPGSAALPATAEAALRELAGRRAGAPVAVAAGGDAGAGLDAQARALPLALRRTRAIQEALIAAGVPAASLRIDAAGMGRGGTVRLLQQ